MKRLIVGPFSLGLMFVALFASAASASFPTGAAPEYHIRLWQTQDGIPDNSVLSILQTRDGYLWVGTLRGLARFDGVQFTVFNSRNTPELENSSITSLFESNDRTLWIGTENGGPVRFKNGRFFGPPAGAGIRAVRCIFQSRDGIVWIGTTNGLFRIQNEKAETVFEGDTFRSICEDKDGQMWFATGQRLRTLREKTLVSVSESFIRGTRAVQADDHGVLWIGSSAGLRRRIGDQMTGYGKSEGLTADMVNVVRQDSSRNIWIGTYGGLNCMTPDGVLHEIKNSGESFDLVYSVCEDVEGNLWVGSRDGLHCLQRKLFTTFTRQHGLAHNNVTSVIEDKAGKLWIGTWGGGLHVSENRTITRITATEMHFNQLILGLRFDRYCDLWIGTDYDGGLFRFSKGQFFRHWKNAQNSELADSASRVILEDSREGRIWVGTSAALNIASRGAPFRRFTTENGLAGNTVRALLEDSEHCIWIGTTGGLTRFTGSNEWVNFTTQDGLSHNSVSALYEDKEDNLWIGTMAGGLCRMKLHQSETSITHYGTRQGLFSDEIFEIIEDNSQRLWMTCRNGVFWVSKNDVAALDAGIIRSIQCVAYGKSDGLGTLACNNAAKPAATKTHDGLLWFGTAKGLSVIDPRDVRGPNSRVPPVMIGTVMADKKKVSEDAAHAFSDSLTQNLTIPAGHGELEFHYAALSFTAPEKHQFKYKLEGFDSDWVNVGPRRIAYYNNLKPGRYTFRVLACNNDGIWNETGASAEFVLLPHYWQTNWFLGLIALTSIGFVAGTVRYMTWKNLRRKLAAVEQQHAIEKERTRIAQDMHDDLGARLTEILMLSNLSASGRGGEREMKACAEKTVTATEDLVRNLDGIVWAVNPRNDSLDQLALYFYEYVQRFFRATNIRYQWEVSPTDLPPIPFSAEIRHNLFLVFKEALNNVAKHSGATEVRLQIQLEKNVLSLSIHDNGKGFSAATPEHFGNGLLNMRKRMEHIGGKSGIQTAPGRGTTVRFELPLRP